jgi:hypothetical protein
MIETIRVFVNGRVVDLPAGTDVEEAVHIFDPALGRQLASGAAYVTDGRGIEMSPKLPLSAGAILRVIVTARRGENVDADA